MDPQGNQSNPTQNSQSINTPPPNEEMRNFRLSPLQFLMICLVIIFSLSTVLVFDYIKGLGQKKSPSHVGGSVKTATVYPTATPTQSLSLSPIQTQGTNPSLTPVYNITVIVNPNATKIPTPFPPLQQQVQVSLSGTIFRDENCNTIKDPNETTLQGVTVNVFQNPQFQLLASPITDSSGNFSYATSIPSDGSIDLQVLPVSPSGYKSNPKQGAYAIRLNASYSHAQFTLPEVPNEDVGKCSQ